MARDIKNFNAKEVIFKEGEMSSCMYDIHFGRVGIYAAYGTEKETLLTELRADDFFGEMGMIECYPRSATAVALEDGTRVEVITTENFGTYFQEKPAKVLQIMQHMSQRIRGLTKDYLEACKAINETVENENISEEKRGKLKSVLKTLFDAYPEAYKTMAEHWMVK
ncbi:MAG: cyclic nucleotide-binding domain-containing protein [Firmicutes bacterium]|nr:cyclic nucleotide-binding domain-containing protein [Bacillota bacterium]